MLFILIAVIGIVLFIIYTYNRAVSLRNFVREAFGVMDVFVICNILKFKKEKMFEFSENEKEN